MPATRSLVLRGNRCCIDTELWGRGLGKLQLVCYETQELGELTDKHYYVHRVGDDILESQQVD